MHIVECNLRISENGLKWCNCCRKGRVKSWGYCSVCGWWDDPGANYDPAGHGLAQNKMSLYEARKAYKKGKTIY